MACCLMALNQCCLMALSQCCLMALSQCWRIISKVHWHPFGGNFTWDTSAINHWIKFEHYLSKILFKSPRANELRYYVGSMLSNTDRVITRPHYINGLLQDFGNSSGGTATNLVCEQIQNIKSTTFGSSKKQPTLVFDLSTHWQLSFKRVAFQQKNAIEKHCIPCHHNILSGHSVLDFVPQGWYFCE